MNGKGDRPRNNFSKRFRDNYDSIEWRKPNCLCDGSGFLKDPSIECPACGRKKFLIKRKKEL